MIGKEKRSINASTLATIQSVISVKLIRILGYKALGVKASCGVLAAKQPVKAETTACSYSLVKLPPSSSLSSWKRVQPPGSDPEISYLSAQDVL